MENEGVGSTYEPYVRGGREQCGGPSEPDVGARVTSCRPSHTHVLTVGVGLHPLPTIRHSLEQDQRGRYDAGTMHHSLLCIQPLCLPHTRSAVPHSAEAGDGHIVVHSHGEQH